MTRTAISPRLAIRIFCSTGANVGGVDGQDHRRARLPVVRIGVQPPARLAAAGARPIPVVADRTWSVWYVAETGSTNADLLAVPRMRPIAPCWSPVTRPPDAAGSTGVGTRHRASTC